MTSTEFERREARLAAAFAVSDAHARETTARKADANRKAREDAAKRKAEREMADAEDDLYDNMPV